MFDTGRYIFFFTSLKDATGADQQKIGSASGAALKVTAPGGSGSATLLMLKDTVPVSQAK